ncbi:hypothetical protein IV203_004254 [Nitzschia inconspicua]|uniref:Uncharacterized protein n=1 Tax=Nitzschia inconspicua TaxID=303405 RepID=A0A9K3PPP9_9STRA|nr:hypothetical protein IV203_004254 [Nitzschia inconspicua]
MSDFHSKFRRRFRLPSDQYRELVEMCTADSMKGGGTSLFKRWRPGKKAALTGKPAAPLELLVLTTLRYLGRDYTSDWEGELGELNANDLPNAVRTLLSNTNPSACSYAGRAVDEEDYFQGSLVRDEDGAIIVRQSNMTDFRQRLITHFDIAFKKKEIIWPKARLQMDEPYANVQP